MQVNTWAGKLFLRTLNKVIMICNHEINKNKAIAKKYNYIDFINCCCIFMLKYNY